MTVEPGWSQVDPESIVSIAGDAAMWSSQEAEGMPIPLLILDTTDRPDLTENIRMHMHVDSGDVNIAWARMGPDIALVLDFLRPIEKRAVVVFQIAKNGVLVDAAIRSGAIYLQAGKPGDRFITTPDSPRILVQIGGTGFEELWETIFRDGLKATFRKRGLNKKEAIRASDVTITNMRAVFAHRLGSS